MILLIQREAFPLTDSCELLIPSLRLWLSLGCSEAERAVPQPVDIDIRIKFMNMLPGCYSDKLEEVVCYHTLTQSVITFLQKKSFHLIEFLAARIFESVEQHLKSIDAVIEVAVTKPNHPVPHIHKGVVFKYCRRVSQKSL